MNGSEILKITKKFMDKYPELVCEDIETLILNLESLEVKNIRWILFEDYNVPELLAFRIYTDTTEPFPEQARDMISDYFDDTEHDINDSFQCGIYDIKLERFLHVNLSPVITWHEDAKQDKGE